MTNGRESYFSPLELVATRKDGDAFCGKCVHVLLIVDTLWGTMGGGERTALRLAALLPAYGFRVSIICFRAPTEESVLSNPPCPIYFLPLHNVLGWQAFRCALALRKFIRKEKVKIVQTFFESSDLWAGSVTKLTSNAKLIWSRRDLGILRDRKHSLAYRLLARMPDAVFAVSELVRRQCIDVDKIAASRVVTVYNGINLSEWSKYPAPSSQQRQLVVTVGNIRHVKGHDILIRAAALVYEKFPDVSFAIAGTVLDDEYMSSLQDLIRKNNLSNNFIFLDTCRDIPALLATANIFVLPSRSEGFSNAIVEAMAASLPAVVTDVGGNAEAVHHAISGFVVPPDDPQALASAILQLLQNPAMARMMGESGRSLVAENFTNETMMKGFTDIYRKLLEDV
jgi:glycosyltransferase involved in cell wall biosynthesis